MTRKIVAVKKFMKGEGGKMIPIYIGAIVLVLLCIVLFFVVKARNEKKRLDAFKVGEKEKTGKLSKKKVSSQIAVKNNVKQQKKDKTLPVENVVKPVEVKKEIKPEDKFEEAQFEAFSLDDKPKKEEMTKKSTENFRHVFTTKKMQESQRKVEEKEENLDEYYDDKFAEYEKFLRENLEDDEEDYSNDIVEELGPLTQVDDAEDEDLDDEDFAELMKELSPKAREIVKHDILKKKDDDDKKD